MWAEAHHKDATAAVSQEEMLKAPLMSLSNAVAVGRQGVVDGYCMVGLHPASRVISHKGSSPTVKPATVHLEHWPKTTCQTSVTVPVVARILVAHCLGLSAPEACLPRTRPGSVGPALICMLGPFEVIKRVGEVAYELSLPASMSRIHPVFHVSLLRKYEDGGRVSSPPPAVLLDGEEECEIQQVLSHRDRSRGTRNKRQLEYFVSWKGMGPEHSEWLRDSDLTNAAELVQEYLDTLEPQDRPAARVGRPTPPTGQAL